MKLRLLVSIRNDAKYLTVFLVGDRCVLYYPTRYSTHHGSLSPSLGDLLLLDALNSETTFTAMHLSLQMYTFNSPPTGRDTYSSGVTTATLALSRLWSGRCTVRRPRPDAARRMRHAQYTRPPARRRKSTP